MKNISKKLVSKAISVLLITVFTLSMTTAAFANEGSENMQGKVLSYSERWEPYGHIEVTVYDLGDGFTSTETRTDEFPLQRISGVKSQKLTVEIKNGSSVAGSVTVSGTFSYDGKSATVTSANCSRTVKSGYTETSWSSGKGNAGLLWDARVEASLTVREKSTSKTYSGSAKVTCSKNGF